MKCSKCKEEKDVSQFWKRTKSKTGYNHWCKSCCRVSARVSNKSTIDKLEAQIRNATVVENKILKKDNKRLCSCGETFVMTTPSKIRCKSCESLKNAEYRSKNIISELERQRIYREKNRVGLNMKRRYRHKLFKEAENEKRRLAQLSIESS